MVLWYDADKFNLDKFASRTIEDAKNESFEAIMAVLTARIAIHLSSIANDFDLGRADLMSITTAINNKTVGTSPGYVPPVIDAVDIQNLTKAITDLNNTIFEASPEKRGLVYQADKPLEVPE